MDIARSACFERRVRDELLYQNDSLPNMHFCRGSSPAGNFYMDKKSTLTHHGHLTTSHSVIIVVVLVVIVGNIDILVITISRKKGKVGIKDWGS